MEGSSEMEIAIMTGLFAEGNMEVDGGHGVRYWILDIGY